MIGVLLVWLFVVIFVGKDIWVKYNGFVDLNGVLFGCGVWVIEVMSGVCNFFWLLVLLFCFKVIVKCDLFYIVFV